jgi:hypothetical protein
MSFYYYSRWWPREEWREKQLFKMANEIEKPGEKLIGDWYLASDWFIMKLWSPSSASGLDSWSNYAGEDMSDHYACVPKTRDADETQESNFRVAKQMFEEQCGPESEDTWEVGSWSHWACGWIERILVHKDYWKGIRLGNEIGYCLKDGDGTLDEQDLQDLQTEYYEKYVSEYFNGEPKLIEKFYELVHDSNTDCGTVDTMDEELADHIKTHLFLCQLPPPDVNALDDEDNVWIHSESLHQCTWCDNFGHPGYFKRGINPEETFVCDECVVLGERLVDERQEKLAL